MIILLVYLLGIFFCFLMAWCLGANDAANPTECAVGAGIVSLKKALVIFALSAALGGILLGPFVMKTIDRGIVATPQLPDSTLILGSFSAILAAVLVVAICTRAGMPTSTTHSIIGGVLGFGLVASPHLINWGRLSIVAVSLLVSPLLALLMASGLFRAFRVYFGKPREWWINLMMSYFFLFFLCFAIGLTVFQKALKWPFFLAFGIALLGAVTLASVCVVWLKKRLEALSAQTNPAKHNPIRTGLAEMKKMAGGFLIIALFFSGFAFGANDMGNATGIFISSTERVAGKPTMEVMFILALLGSMGIAVGCFTWGHRVIKTAGFKITRLDPITGLAAEYSNALTIFIFTVVPFYLIGFGIPISTTHASIGSIIGVGLIANGLRGVHKHTVRKILSTWALTIPCAAALSVGLYLAFSNIVITV